MLNSILGKKIGMTQIFTEKGEVVPITVVDIANLFITQIKTPTKDGYAALQLGLLRRKYKKQSFLKDWCKNKKKYFSYLREVEIAEESLKKIKVGQEIKMDNINFQKNNIVKVSGKSIGLGFQGVVKRWGFSGGPGGHGSNFHRIPGSIGNLCKEGEVEKGKKLPGRCGNKKITIKGLEIINLDNDNNYLFIKGAVPGKKDSLLFIRRQG